jgi:hypothetical protein
LDGSLKDLPQKDDINIGWPEVMTALNGHILAGSSITFLN